MAHYLDVYWNKAIERLETEKDLYVAFEGFFVDAARIYTRPGLSRGCFIDNSAAGLPASDARVMEAIDSNFEKTRELFRARLMKAIDERQLTSDSDIPCIVGSLMAFGKGIATLARGNLCQSELMEIARRGILLIPPRDRDKQLYFNCRAT